MSKKTGLWIVLAFAVAFAAIMYTSTRNLSSYRVEVCIEFDGRSACRTASAATREQAQRTATDNACAQLASGMSQSIQCTNTRPSKVTWLDTK
jgi:hypothetical protein